MALWGKTDTLASAPKYVARKAYFDGTAVDITANTINLLASNTGFSTGDKVKYVMEDANTIDGISDTGFYYVRVVGTAIIELYDTYAHAIALNATTGRLDLGGTPEGLYSLQRTGESNAFGDHINNGKQIIFVDASEAEVEANKAKGITNAGWYLYRTYTDAQSQTRHKAECLVAIRVAASDAGDAEDTVAADLVFAIDVQPQDTLGYEGGNPDTATFSVVMDTNAADSDVDYQWQKSDDAGETWYDIAGGTASTYTTGSLTIADDDGDKYRVIVKCGDQTITSNEVTLSVQMD